MGCLLHVSFFYSKKKQVMHACKSSFLGLGWNWSTGLLMHEDAQLLEKNVHFLLGARLTA